MDNESQEERDKKLCESINKRYDRQTGKARRAARVELAARQQLEQMASGLEVAIEKEGGLMFLEYVSESCLNKLRSLVLAELDRRGEKKLNG